MFRVRTRLSDVSRKRLLAVVLCATIPIVAAVVVSYVRRPKVLYRVVFLPTMGGVQTRAHAINDSGQVVSSVRWADGTVHVTLCDKSDRTQELASFPKGYQVPTLALNNAGQVAGTVIDSNQVWSSLFWDTDGRRYMLDAPSGGQTQIGGMNNRGQVAGKWYAARGPSHAFLWDKTSGLQDLGTFGGIESLACGINDAGQIVGYFSTVQNQWRAFFSDPNVGMQELAPTKFGPAAVCRINNQGFVVGHFGSADDDACISTWTAGTGPRRLPSAKGDWADARGLDDANQFFVNVHHRGVRLLGRRFWDRSESYMWESDRRLRCLNQHVDRGDTKGLWVYDINKDGTILASLSVRKLPYPHAVILEPVP